MQKKIKDIFGKSDPREVTLMCNPSCPGEEYKTVRINVEKFKESQQVHLIGKASKERRSFGGGTIVIDMK